MDRASQVVIWWAQAVQLTAMRAISNMAYDQDICRGMNSSTMFAWEPEENC